jgi:hypothetical protein
MRPPMGSATLLVELRWLRSVEGSGICHGRLTSTRTLPDMSEFAAIANASWTFSSGST